MPRMYDYDAGDIAKVEYENKTLEVRSLGKLEDKDLFFGTGYGPAFAWFYGQFEAYVYDTVFMDQVHAWIDAHATAPWYWFEQSSNHGHSVSTNIWFSSLEDLSLFAAEWVGRQAQEKYPGKKIELNSVHIQLNGNSIESRRQWAAAQATKEVTS